MEFLKNNAHPLSMLLDFLYNRLNFLELWHGFHSGCVWLLGKSWSRIEMSFEFFWVHSGTKKGLYFT